MSRQIIAENCYISDILNIRDILHIRCKRYKKRERYKTVDCSWGMICHGSCQ